MNLRAYLLCLLVAFHVLLLFGFAWILGLCWVDADWFGLAVTLLACAVNVSGLYNVLVE